MATLPPNNSLGYLGVRAVNPPNVTIAQRAPNGNDIQNQAIGDLWVDEATQASYELVGTTLGSAVWTALGGGGAVVSTINNLPPTGGNITIAGTASEISVANAGSTVTLSLPNAITAPGSITATTTLTATLGNIKATNGNLVLNTAGNKIVSTSVASTTAAGANSFGTVTLVGGTATVSTTAVTANSIIFLTRMSVGATGNNSLGILSIGTITATTSFVINAWETTSATTLESTDVSVIGWMIVN